MVEPVAVRVGNKGRIVLPALLRKEIDVAEGDEMIARAAGRGRIIIETREAIKGRLRDEAAAARAKPGVVERLFADRKRDGALESRRRPRARARS